MGNLTSIIFKNMPVIFFVSRKKMKCYNKYDIQVSCFVCYDRNGA